MFWDAEKDELFLRQKPVQKNIVATKRDILQQISKVYDPLGFFSPVTIRAKILLQELWQQKYDWDAPLPSTIQQLWHEIADDLNAVSSQRFHRQYIQDCSETDDTALHVFADASPRAYGACVYICRNGFSRLVMSKTRVAPLKALTLPRLELMAAVIGARLGRHVMESIDVKTMFLWTDSQIVLHWLQTSRPQKTFTANRVREIHELTENRKWRYCPTSENPADLLTRGISSNQYQTSSVWQNGPNWLQRSEKWPTWEYDATSALTAAVLDMPEENLPADIHVTSAVESTPGIHNIIEIEKYSRYKKLLRVTAYVLRFVNNCKAKKPKTSSTSTLKLEPLTVSELHAAEMMWLQCCQYTTYRTEISNMQSKGQRLPLVRQLRLFLDIAGNIRCGGRIHNAPLQELARFPYLLPARHTLTRLIVTDAHCTLLHAGATSVITYLRQKYWVPSIRQCVQSVLRKCVTCRKITGKQYTAPDPPPLAKYRVDDTPPFTATGVDFTGALYVRDTAKNEQKAYVCLFTCASTRAVHLELVPNLTEESFMLAFRRFTSRKSLPRIMVSDNATTFSAASTHIKQLCQSSNVRETLSNQGTEWKFFPKRAPWFGGWWERLIGLTKTAIKKTLGRSYVSYEKLQTVVTEVEAYLNDRPLTYISSDSSDPDVLTPSHLLYGRRIIRLPYRDAPDDSLYSPTLGNQNSLIRRSRVVDSLISGFRRRWKLEYLTALREHHRETGTNEQTIKTGDVVQIHDDVAPRLQWKLGIVEQLLTGNDGFTRAATIRTKHGLTTRPVVKLFPLEG